MKAPLARVAIAILCVALFGAGFARADAANDAPAGFAPSLWISQSSVTEGDRVKIYATVYDSGDEAIRGTVVFLADGSAIGSQPFSLAAGASSIVSAEWKASAGTHALKARIDGPVGKDSGQPLALADATSDVSVTVADAPPPTKAQAVANAAGKAVDAATPAVITAAKTILAGTESARQAGADYFAAQLADADAPSGTSTDSSAVLGTSTYRAPAQTASAAASGFMRSLNRALFAVFASPGLFYFALIAILLLFFWLIGRRFGSRNA